MEQTTAKVIQHGSSWANIEMIFTLFGMVLTLGGLVGGHKVKLISIEFGPIRSKWRRTLMTSIGLIILTCIGLLNMQ